LANGDLDARLQVRNQGGDETDELARDFNTMAEQLKRRMQAQKRLLSDVSHELRSPLARLRIALALVEENPTGGEKYLSRIEQEAERLEELIAQLLSSQVQDVPLDAHIDIAKLLESLCADANFEGRRGGKEVIFTSDSSQLIVNSSGDLLRKCFENILRNALVHTPDNSQVTVALTVSDSHYKVSVEDQGPGVPETELDTIFDEFYRVDTARSRESGGYGLGLAIARRAIVQHHGEITAQNTGTGLAINICLPLHPGPRANSFH
jgi:signal transduction histidine kinase